MLDMTSKTFLRPAGSASSCRSAPRKDRSENVQNGRPAGDQLTCTHLDGVTALEAVATVVLIALGPNSVLRRGPSCRNSMSHGRLRLATRAGQFAGLAPPSRRPSRRTPRRPGHPHAVICDGRARRHPCRLCGGRSHCSSAHLPRDPGARLAFEEKHDVPVAVHEHVLGVEGPTDLAGRPPLHRLAYPPCPPERPRHPCTRAPLGTPPHTADGLPGRVAQARTQAISTGAKAVPSSWNCSAASPLTRFVTKSSPSAGRPHTIIFCPWRCPASRRAASSYQQTAMSQTLVSGGRAGARELCTTCRRGRWLRTSSWPAGPSASHPTAGRSARSCGW